MLQAVDQTTNFQRAAGKAAVAFEHKNGQTRLSSLHQAGCLKAVIPQNHHDRPDIVLVNTSGGLTGGDHLSQSFQIGENAKACCTTQAAERIYKATHGSARIENSVEIGSGGSFEWLPQETILFDHSSMNRSMKVDMAANARCLLLESFVLGRTAMGETLSEGHHKDTWKVYRDGKLVRMEALEFDVADDLDKSATLADAVAFSTLVYVAPDAEARRDESRTFFAGETVDVAVSAWDGCLVIRAKSENSQNLRTTLTRYLKQFCDYPLPRVWHM